MGLRISPPIKNTVGAETARVVNYGQSGGKLPPSTSLARSTEAEARRVRLATIVSRSTAAES